jgi:AcrR family transcriptional regulator
MAQNDRTVKKKRSYDSSRRQEHARRSRARILDAAERRFLQDGYGPTTIAEIAADAGVSADTIYKSFHSKAGVVRAIRARALEGEGAVPAEQRSDALHQQHESDPRKIIEAWGAFVSEITPRTAPILLLIRAAATTDPEAAALLNEMDADRLRRMTLNARRLHDAGHLRAGITVARAADVLWTYSAPELYELLVVRRSWSPQRYGRFVADAMINALL